MPFNIRKNQSGLALVSVLLVIFVLVAVTGRLTSNHNIVVSRHANTFEHDQAIQYLFGAESMAKEALYNDYLTTGSKIDHLGEIWASNIMPFELDEGGFLEIHVNDLNACVNLNNVLSETSKESVKTVNKLLLTLGLPTEIEDLWRDWIDKDSEVKGLGAEDMDYASNQIPYRTPNRIVINFSELMLLKSISAEHLSALSQYACLVPDSNSRINVNTAPAEVLQVLSENVSASELVTLTETQRAFESPEQFVQSFPKFQKSLGKITTSSMYFEMSAQAKVGNTKVSLSSLIYRNPKNGKISILKRDFGKLFTSKIQIETEIQSI